jgi:adenine-specific DNA-methyltransferase
VQQPLTETIKDGKAVRTIDFDVLKQELSDSVIEGPKERYQFTWPDKKKAILLANAPIAKTLRPCREESVDFDTTENLYIEGDNLEVLKLLQETYLGKVKMIYIDPPYNTGNDFVYKDDFAQNTDEYLANSGQFTDTGERLVANLESNGRFHTDWLNIMYPRLKLAKDLLTDDGVIFISIDENEVENLKKISCEIFGCNNFSGEIIWKNSSKNDQAYISIQHEYILCFVKNKAVNLGEWYEPKEGIDEILKAFEEFKTKYGNDYEAIHKAALEWYKNFQESNPIYASKHYSWMDGRGVYFPADISGPNYGQYRYDVIHPITGKVCKEPASGWRYPEETMKKRIKDGFVHFGKDETTIPNNKTYLLDTINQSISSVKYKDGRVASKQLTALLGSNCFTNPKDISILVNLMNAINLQENDIILDFFSGSSTTAHAVMELNIKNLSNVQFIMVQVQENLDKMLEKATGSSKQVLKNAISFVDKLKHPHLMTELGKERIRRAGQKIKAEAEGDMVENLDIGFRVLKVDSSNMEDVYYNPIEIPQTHLRSMVDNIKQDRTAEDLLFQVMLDLGVLLSAKIEEKIIDGKKVFNVADGYLLACFDADVTDETVKEIAKCQPYYAVFRDSSLANDNVATNFEQIFATYSPTTVRKVL